jgi:hypothetical protein
VAICVHADRRRAYAIRAFLTENSWAMAADTRQDLTRLVTDAKREV